MPSPSVPAPTYALPPEKVTGTSAAHAVPPLRKMSTSCSTESSAVSPVSTGSRSTPSMTLSDGRAVTPHAESRVVKMSKFIARAETTEAVTVSVTSSV